MQITKEDIDRLSALDDSEFSAKLMSALSAAGAAQSVKSKFTDNIPQIKKALQSLSPGDIEALCKKLDDASLDALKNEIMQ